MIDENETLNRFGYTSSVLAKQSKKLVAVTCNDCDKLRLVPKYAYRDLCPSCASKKQWSRPGKKEQRSIAYKGTDNPFFGKQHSEETKKSIAGKMVGRHMLLSPGESAKKKVIRRYKKSANERGICFNLSRAEIDMLMNSKCHYCGSFPNNTYRHGKGNGDFVYSGIDRKDNNKGYELSNCVSCCALCNMNKRDLGYDDFLKWVKTVYQHLVKNGE